MTPAGYRLFFQAVQPAIFARRHMVMFLKQMVKVPSVGISDSGGDVGQRHVAFRKEFGGASDSPRRNEFVNGDIIRSAFLVYLV